MVHKRKADSKTYVSVNYVDALTKLVPQVQAGDSIGNPLVVPFILTCAAALEAKLNDELVTWAWVTLGRESYKRIADALLSMNLRGKVDVLVPILTGNRFEFRKDSSEYQSLGRLVSQRNTLVHDKAYYESFEIEIDDPANPKSVQFPPDAIEKMQKAPFRSASANDCQGYYAALMALDSKLLYPLEAGALAENDMIRLVEK